VKYKKKLIEVNLPLEAINKESLHRKQKAPKGWPSSFHKWWAQRPLAAARAVIFSQIIDDPSSNTEDFPTKESQDKERDRLFKIIEELVLWDNTHNENVVKNVRNEIRKMWLRTCRENSSDPRAGTLFNPEKLPPFYDPFAGGATLPLAAQWLGMETFASDLNPVAVMINKALIELPRKFIHKPAINPNAFKQQMQMDRSWKNSQGLAEDVRYYSNWIKERADKSIGKFYEDIEITEEMTLERPDLQKYLGEKLKVVAWLWARSVKSPNPAFSDIDVPLASTFILSSKAGKEAYVEPIVGNGTYKFVVRLGKPTNSEQAKNGTKLARGANFQCLMSSAPMSNDYIRNEFKSKRSGHRLMAIVAEGERGRLYLSPTNKQEKLALSANPSWRPEAEMNQETSNLISGRGYGFANWHEIYTNRQLLSLTTFIDLIKEAQEEVFRDGINAGLSNDELSLEAGGTGAKAYSEAIGAYLSCVIDRMAYYGSSLTTWLPKDSALRDCMPRQALAMAWDYAEGNPLGKSSGDILTCANSVSNYLEVASPFSDAYASQCDAQTGLKNECNFIYSTDPPYYDNIAYADLSDYFYIWLRSSLKSVFPSLFNTLAVPKAEELVATPYRHGGKKKAEEFFLYGMTQAMRRLAETAHPAFPVTIYYAFKQSENDEVDGTTNTGWDTFLEAVLQAGFAITGTWPMRTEGAGRMIASGTNALASSIVLVCRKKIIDAPTATRREFIAELKAELPRSIALLQSGNIAPVDLAQAAIGPGMGVFTKFSKVLDAQGKELTVKMALALINQTMDEVLAEQEGDFDSDSKWALTWFDQYGFEQGEYGVAEQLSKSKVTSVEGLVDGGIISSKSGKVSLLRPIELKENWDPLLDKRITAWEVVHQLIRALETSGEELAGVLVAKLGAQSEVARELCYRLYTLCERKKRANEAMSYNALVQSWPEIIRISRETSTLKKPGNQDLFDRE
jgi:putative DNA methylase